MTTILVTDKNWLQEIYDLRIRAWENSDRKGIINRRAFPGGWWEEVDPDAHHFVSDSIDEMLRVSKEVRIFPLYSINGKPSDYLPDVTVYLTGKGHSWTIQNNNYCVYKDGNRFLKITRLRD